MILSMRVAAMPGSNNAPDLATGIFDVPIAEDRS
jgi:hypothetical protein